METVELTCSEPLRRHQLGQWQEQENLGLNQLSWDSRHSHRQSPRWLHGMLRPGVLGGQFHRRMTSHEVVIERLGPSRQIVTHLSGLTVPAYTFPVQCRMRTTRSRCVHAVSMDVILAGVHRCSLHLVMMYVQLRGHLPSSVILMLTAETILPL